LSVVHHSHPSSQNILQSTHCIPIVQTQTQTTYPNQNEVHPLRLHLLLRGRRRRWFRRQRRNRLQHCRGRHHKTHRKTGQKSQHLHQQHQLSPVQTHSVQGRVRRHRQCIHLRPHEKEIQRQISERDLPELRCEKLRLTFRLHQLPDLQEQRCKSHPNPPRSPLLHATDS
jgi:hypothetical protein